MDWNHLLADRRAGFSSESRSGILFLSSLSIGRAEASSSIKALVFFSFLGTHAHSSLSSLTQSITSNSHSEGARPALQGQGGAGGTGERKTFSSSSSLQAASGGGGSGSRKKAISPEAAQTRACRSRKQRLCAAQIRSFTVESRQQQQQTQNRRAVSNARIENNCSRS